MLVLLQLFGFVCYRLLLCVACHGVVCWCVVVGVAVCRCGSVLIVVVV